MTQNIFEMTLGQNGACVPQKPFAARWEHAKMFDKNRMGAQLLISSILGIALFNSSEQPTGVSHLDLTREIKSSHS